MQKIYQNIIKFFSYIFYSGYSFDDNQSKYLASKVIYFLSKHLKIHISFEEICDLCGDGYKIASIFSVKNTLHKLNININSLNSDLKAIKNKTLIIRTINNYFLYMPQKQGYKIYDALNNQVKYSLNITLNKAEYIVVESTIKQNKCKWQQLLSKLLFNKLGIFNVLNITIVIITVFYSLTTRIYFDYLILKQFQQWFIVLILIFLLIIIIQIILHVMVLLIKAEIEVKIINYISQKLYKKILFLPLQFFENRHVGKIVDYFWATERVGDAFLNGLVTNLLSIPIIVGLSVVMFYMQPIISIIAFTVLLLYAICIIYLLVLKLKSTTSMRSTSEYFFSYFSNVMSNIDTVQATSREQFELSKIQKYQDRYSNCFTNCTTLDNLIINFNQLYNFLTPLIIFSISIYFITNTNQITIGSVVAYITLFTVISQLFLQIILGAKDYINSLVDINLINCISSYNNVTINPKNGIFNSKSSITLSEVSYRYNMNSEWVLQNLNLEIAPEQHIALVGNNGSGKSTLLKLLVGLYQVSQGKYLLGNCHITESNHIFLRDVIAYMGQTSFIFSGTLKDNITLWSKNISVEILQNAIKDAELSELVAYRGLNTFINSSYPNLSAGEQQRIELARVLVKQPKILLLDEATANLDEITQQKIISNLKKRRITIIQVAHRISAIENCDVIHVLEFGKIIASGTYRDLLAKQLIT